MRRIAFIILLLLAALFSQSARADCSDVVTPADIDRAKAEIVQAVESYGYGTTASVTDAEAAERARYDVNRAYDDCLMRQAISRDDATADAAARAGAAMDAAAAASTWSTPQTMPPTFAPVPVVPSPSLPPPSGVPVPDPCAMTSCAASVPQPPPRFVPYGAVGGLMPGINPNGTAQ